MDQIPGLLDLIKVGGLSGTLALAVWVIWQLKGELIRVYEARSIDSKALIEVVHDNSTAVAAFAATSEARNRASEAQAKSLELSALSQTQMAAELQRLRDIVVELKVAIKDVRDDKLLRRGGDS